MSRLGPIGRLRFDSYRLPSGGEWPKRVARLGVEDLTLVQSLLASGPHEHARRIRNGDVLLGARDERGELVGIVWINVHGHPDRYAGRLARPTTSATYLNQLMVKDTHRGQGFGSDLVRGVQALSAEVGRNSVQTLVRPDNHSSVATMRSAGGVLEARLYGFRFGRLGALRLIRRVP